MSEMVERVAKALWADTPQITNCPRPTGWTFESEPAELQDAYRSNARAAIEAMREPTPEMIQARIDSYPAELRIRQSDLEVYRAMLTAALA